MSDYPIFDSYGYPSDETLERIEKWPYDDFPGLMEYVAEAWSDYGWFENCPSMLEPLFHGEEDGHYWCYATGGWSGNESIVGALDRNVLFSAMCWSASLRGGYGEFHVRPMT